VASSLECRLAAKHNVDAGLGNPRPGVVVDSDAPVTLDVEIDTRCANDRGPIDDLLVGRQFASSTTATPTSRSPTARRRSRSCEPSRSRRSAATPSGRTPSRPTGTCRTSCATPPTSCASSAPTSTTTATPAGPRASGFGPRKGR